MDMLYTTAPFEGLKMFGNGREWGTSGVDACIEEMSFIGCARASVRRSA
jgi:acyl-CoA reductase-like NAD-dependent aldehyde dehydrogenase